jgi:hypothetical protein
MTNTKENDDITCNDKNVFDEYLDAKKRLVEKLKSIVTVLINTQSLDVSEPGALPYLAKKMSWVSSYQWQYNEGHETIYCRPSYCAAMCQGCRFTMVKVPVRYLSMSEEDILAELSAEKVKALKDERKRIIAQKDAALAKYDSKLEDIDAEIKKFKVK